jgi:hypothetical protein
MVGCVRTVTPFPGNINPSSSSGAMSKGRHSGNNIHRLSYDNQCSNSMYAGNSTYLSRLESRANQPNRKNQKYKLSETSNEEW